MKAIGKGYDEYYYYSAVRSRPSAGGLSADRSAEGTDLAQAGADLARAGALWGQALRR